MALALLMLAHSSGALRIPLVDEIEDYLYDTRLRWTMPGTRDERIVIVDIDERSIAEQGHFPWQRDKLAGLVNNLFEYYEVRVAAFDILFAEPEESTALQLIDQLRGLPGMEQAPISLAALENQWQTDRQFTESVIARDVILGFVFRQQIADDSDSTTGMLPEPSIRADQLSNVAVPFYEAEGYVGNFDELQLATEFGAFFSYPRFDDVTRRTPLLQSYRGDLYESLGLAAARLYLGQPPLRLEFGDPEDFSGLTLENLLLGELPIPVDERAQVYIPFRGPQGSFPYVSATDVLNLRVGPELLRDKLVLIGTSAAGLMDLRATPVADTYAGVEIHANLASAILDGRFLRSPAYVSGMELVQVLGNLLLMMLLIPLLSPALATLLIALLLVANVGLNLYAWQALQLILPLASVLAAIVTMAFLQIVHDYFVESRRKQRLSRIFGQYIPAELVEEIDASGEELSLEGESRDMTVLFSDVRGFTAISENLEPRELTRFMNEFLTPITRIIHEHRGTIDKYMGDAVMAFWGAPLRDREHAQHAVTAAMTMVAAMRQVTEDFEARGWPPIKIGIGVSSGAMNVGNMGSAFRMAYTVMGDVVNLGSRLEGLTKIYGADIVISEDTAQRISGFALRELDRVRVVGKLATISIYQPLGRTQDIAAELAREIDSYHEALELYRSREFARAEQAFQALQANSPCALYRLYLERLTAFRAIPPGQDWDGVFIASTK